jgi:hypothetical protein
MFSFQRWWRAIAAATALACGTAAQTAPSLTTIRDVLYKADGSRFSGTLTIQWTNFTTADQTMIPVQATNIEVTNGSFVVRLAPTTTASAGANYRVRYSSQGKFQFEEIWAVPPSAVPLNIREVRVGTGSVVGPPPVLTQIEIGDVSGLSSELSQRPRRGAGFAPSRAAVINPSGHVDAAAGNLSDCVRVDGTSGPCGEGGSWTSVAFADAETPGGAVNGTNATFSTANVPAPAASVALFRNGMLMKPGADFTLNGNAITFLSGAIPAAGDLLTVSYRYSKSGQLAVTANFVDAETPTGVVNGTNAVFGIAQTPTPAVSLQLYRNGILMKQGADYSITNRTITFVAISVPQQGDLLQASYRYGDTAAALASSYYSGPQVLCNGAGGSTASGVSVDLGRCTISPGVLSPGDRVEIRAEYAHTGNSAGFNSGIYWGAGTILQRSAAASESALSSRADAVIHTAGVQWATQSWGGSTALLLGSGSAAEVFSEAISIRFTGWLTQASGDELVLRNFTVLRYPAQF